MNELKVGDRVEVICTGKFNGFLEVGMKGTVKDKRDERIGIEFDDYIGGHDGLWDGEDEYCWYLDNRLLKKIDESEGKK